MLAKKSFLETYSVNMDVRQHHVRDFRRVLNVQKFLVTSKLLALMLTSLKITFFKVRLMFKPHISSDSSRQTVVVKSFLGK